MILIVGSTGDLGSQITDRLLVQGKQIRLLTRQPQGAVEGSTGGVARVEGIGPLLLEQVRALLGHTNVALKPVVDLADRVSVNAYEHPETVKERVHLRTLGEVFPYGRATGRRVDMDHPVPYDPLGPPGQTGDDNAGPLSRTPHRAKTHLGYRVTQTGLTEYVWSTPHGLHRLVEVEMGGVDGGHTVCSAHEFHYLGVGAIPRSQLFRHGVGRLG